MRTRCHNENFHKYPLYGGRGITICERWDDYDLFVNDMGRKPGSGFSIDRIDVNGNYEPSNCRWADATTQARNQNMRKDNTSGYRGVSYDLRSGKWLAYIQVKKKMVWLGKFKTPENADHVRRSFQGELWV